jgi:hypothetical protein
MLFDHRHGQSPITGRLMCAEAARRRVLHFVLELVYRDHGSHTLIETRYCYQYATRDAAVLRWDGRYGSSKLIFSNDTSCDVVALR